MPLLLFFHKVGWILVEFGVVNLLLLAIVRMRLRGKPPMKSRVAYALAGGLLLSMVAVGGVMAHMASPSYIPIAHP